MALASPSVAGAKLQWAWVHFYWEVEMLLSKQFRKQLRYKLRRLTIFCLLLNTDNTNILPTGAVLKVI